VVHSLRGHRNTHGRNRLVILVGRILGQGNGLTKVHASLEQQHQLDAAQAGPVQTLLGNLRHWQGGRETRSDGWRGGVEKHAQPHRLLRKVIRVPGVLKQSRRVESLAQLGVRKFAALFGRDGVLERLEHPMLFVRNSLHNSRAENKPATTRSPTAISRGPLITS